MRGVEVDRGREVLQQCKLDQHSVQTKPGQQKVDCRAQGTGEKAMLAGIHGDSEKALNAKKQSISQASGFQNLILRQGLIEWPRLASNSTT